MNLYETNYVIKLLWLTEWEQMWFIETGYWDISYLVTLAAVCCLWRPNSQSMRYMFYEQFGEGAWPVPTTPRLGAGKGRLSVVIEENSRSSIDEFDLSEGQSSEELMVARWAERRMANGELSIATSARPLRPLEEPQSPDFEDFDVEVSSPL